METSELLQIQEPYILKASEWLKTDPGRYGATGDVGHNLFLMKQDDENVVNLLETSGYIESYSEINHKNDFEGYSLWKTFYKSILLTDSEIYNNIKEISTLLKDYNFMYVDSFFLMTEKEEYFNAFTD